MTRLSRPDRLKQQKLSNARMDMGLGTPKLPIQNVQLTGPHAKSSATYGAQSATTHLSGGAHLVSVGGGGNADGVGHKTETNRSGSAASLTNANKYNMFVPEFPEQGGNVHHQPGTNFIGMPTSSPGAGVSGTLRQQAMMRAGGQAGNKRAGSPTGHNPMGVTSLGGGGTPAPARQLIQEDEENPKTPAAGQAVMVPGVMSVNVKKTGSADAQPAAAVPFSHAQSGSEAARTTTTTPGSATSAGPTPKSGPVRGQIQNVRPGQQTGRFGGQQGAQGDFGGVITNAAATRSGSPTAGGNSLVMQPSASHTAGMQRPMGGQSTVIYSGDTTSNLRKQKQKINSLSNLHQGQAAAPGPNMIAGSGIGMPGQQGGAGAGAGAGGHAPPHPGMTTGSSGFAQAGTTGGMAASSSAFTGTGQGTSTGMGSSAFNTASATATTGFRAGGSVQDAGATDQSMVDKLAAQKKFSQTSFAFNGQEAGANRMVRERTAPGTKKFGGASSSRARSLSPQGQDRMAHTTDKFVMRQGGPQLGIFAPGFGPGQQPQDSFHSTASHHHSSHQSVSAGQMATIGGKAVSNVARVEKAARSQDLRHNEAFAQQMQHQHQHQHSQSLQFNASTTSFAGASLETSGQGTMQLAGASSMTAAPQEGMTAEQHQLMQQQHGMHGGVSLPVLGRGQSQQHDAQAARSKKMKQQLAPNQKGNFGNRLKFMVQMN